MPSYVSDRPEVVVAAGAPPVVRLADSMAAGAAETWVADHRAELRAILVDHGAVLVRGLCLSDVDEMAGVSKRLSTTLITEREGFAPRDTYADGVYSGSHWPADQPMCMHHELSYALDVPSLMIFGCLRAPDEGGATALADGQAVLGALPDALVERFGRVGWRLLRSYRSDLGVPLVDAFGVDGREAVLDYCAANDIEAEWLDEDWLRTTQRRAAVVRHPVTGVRCWFNQIAFLNARTLDEDLRDYLVAEFGEAGLPFDTGYGDGTPIDDATVHQINACYEANTVRERWQSGDLLLVDNIRMAHSREPFTGDRDVVVAMGDPIRLADR
jgi:alpha-ketoglutarate-dependent taurine dioxygenase